MCTCISRVMSEEQQTRFSEPISDWSLAMPSAVSTEMLGLAVAALISKSVSIGRGGGFLVETRKPKGEWASTFFRACTRKNAVPPIN